MMGITIRDKAIEKKPEVILCGKGKVDGVYVVADHKGNPDAVKKKEGKVEGSA